MAGSDSISDTMVLIPCGRKKQSKSDAHLQSNFFNNLCDELMAEILLRLPTSTTAVRFQVVCKRWYSLISSPYFIDRFIQLRHHRDVQSSLVFQNTCNSGDCRRIDSEFKAISNSSLLCVYGFRLDYLPFSHTGLLLKASFDDLILCSCTTYAQPYVKQIIYYYIINPLTRQWIALPPPSAHLWGIMVIGFLCVPPPCSECKSVDSWSDQKFMVVRLFIPDSPTPSSMFEVQIFSTEDGQWRTLVVSSSLPLRGSAVHTCPLVAYRGVLHWLNDDCIAVYDPLNTPETFSRIIHLPIRPRRRRDYFGFKLCVCQGRLRVVVGTWSEDRDHVLDVWELEDYDSGLWNLVHKQLYLNNLTYDNSLPIAEKSLQGNLLILNLHPENGDIFYMQTNDGIALVNMKTRKVERYHGVKKNARIITASSFHLADKWWPTPVSSLLH